MAYGKLLHPNVKRGKALGSPMRKMRVNVIVYRADGLSTGLTQKLYERSQRQGKNGWVDNLLFRQALKGRGYCAVAHVNRNYAARTQWKTKKKAGGTKWSETSCAKTPTQAVKAALRSMMRAMH